MGLVEKTYEAMAELVAYGRAPLMVILGPSGSGKTTFLKNFIGYLPKQTPWFLFYNAVRASEYGSLQPGNVTIGADCLYSYCYEAFKYIDTQQRGIAAVAEAIACELLRMKGLTVPEQCEDVQVNASILEWARLELKPMLKWIDVKCTIQSGAIPYWSHVDLLRLALMRCCIQSPFVAAIDDIQLAPRIKFEDLIKSLRDTASVIVAVHPDKSLERNVVTMLTSSYITCLTPRENWSKMQIDYIRFLTERELRRRIEPVWGAYKCYVLQKEYDLPLPPPKEEKGDKKEKGEQKRRLLGLFKK